MRLAGLVLVLGLFGWGARAGESGPGEAEASRAAPATARSARILFSAQTDKLETGERGGGGGFEVVLPAGAPWLDLGVYYFALAGSRWRYARLGAFGAHASRWSYELGADLGQGEAPAGDFHHLNFRGAATYAIRPGRLYLRIAEQYIDIDTTYGNLIKLGGSIIPRADLSINAEYAKSTSGNADSQYLVARADLSLARMRLYAGVSWGTSGIENAELPGFEPGGKSLRDFFVGAVYSWGSADLSLGAETLRSGDFDRQTLHVSGKLEL